MLRVDFNLCFKTCVPQVKRHKIKPKQSNGDHLNYWICYQYEARVCTPTHPILVQTMQIFGKNLGYFKQKNFVWGVLQISIKRLNISREAVCSLTFIRRWRSDVSAASLFHAFSQPRQSLSWFDGIFNLKNIKHAQSRSIHPTENTLAGVLICLNW